MQRRRPLMATIAFLMLVAPATAGSADLVVSNPYMRTVLPSLPAAGYFTLQNTGDTDRVLVGASSPDCGSLMLHKSESVNGVEQMLPVDSVPVPAHGSVSFAPGGFHLMCMSPAAGMKIGSVAVVTLKFKDNAILTSDFPVQGVQRPEPK
jgi:periplasmic copper chaperone A